MIAEILSIVMGLILLVMALALYMFPWLLAMDFKHKNLAGIGVLNFFLGWSLIGWVLSLVWAVTD